MSTDSIGHATNKVFTSQSTKRVKKPDPVEKDRRHPTSEDPSGEEEDFSRKKRHEDPEYPTYGKDGQPVPADPHGELDVEG